MIIVQQLYTPRWKRLDASFQVITEPFLNRCVYDACKAFLIFVKMKKKLSPNLQNFGQLLLKSFFDVMTFFTS